MNKDEIKNLMGGTLIAIDLATVIPTGNGFLVKSFDRIESEINDVLAEAWTLIEPKARENDEYDFAQEQITNLAIYIYSGFQDAMLHSYSKTGNPAMWETADALGERGFKLSVA